MVKKRGSTTMNKSTIFDTLQYVKKLKEAGVPEKQAEVQAEALHEIIDERLATKEDLKLLEERLTYKLTIRFGSMLISGLVTSVVLLAAFITVMKFV